MATETAYSGTANLDLEQWQRHVWLNRLQTALILAAMAGFLALLGYLLWGPNGVFHLLVFGALLALLNPAASPRLTLRLYRAQPLSAWEVPQLAHALNELSRRAGLPAVPALYYVPSRMVNAFAVGTPRDSAIAVTDGLLRTLDLREVIGVFAHELSHIRNNDLQVMGLADLISRLTSFLSLLGQFLLVINLPLVLLSDTGIDWLAIALLVFAPHFALLAQLGLSRTREYDADLNAALLTGDPEGLARALAKIERLHRSLFERLMIPGWRMPEPSWLRTHPPTEERVRRLLSLEPGIAERPLARPGLDPGVAIGRPGIARRPRYHTSGLWY